jgi:hypothetical protein
VPLFEDVRPPIQQRMWVPALDKYLREPRAKSGV